MRRAILGAIQGPCGLPLWRTFALAVASTGLVQASFAAQPVLSAAPVPEAKSVLPSAERREIRAQLAPHRFTTVAAEIGAKVNHLSVKEGGRFRAGQTLVSFDCTLQNAQLDKARATLQAAEKVHAGNVRLAELNSVGKIELDQSDGEVKKNKADLAAMQAMLGKCTVAAPFSGRIAEQKVREQQYVQPGQAMLDIIDDSVLEIEFLVPSKWLAWIRTGTAFRISIDETRKDYPAKVQRIGARVDPVSQSVKIVATISGNYPDLIAGMSGHVNLSAPAGF